MAGVAGRLAWAGAGCFAMMGPMATRGPAA
jgi:hypothetical protein